MKKVFFTLAMLCGAMMGNAQVTDEQSAILQNGDNAQIFYGEDALKDAMEAAPDRGATITLSAGTFNACEITKCVNIYGAGWVTDNTPKNNENTADNSIRPTNITGRVDVNLPETLTPPHNIHLEGLRFNNGFNAVITSEMTNIIDGLELVKCYIKGDFGNNSVAFYETEHKNIQLIQCCLSVDKLCAFYDMTLENCYVGVGNNSIAHTTQEGNNLVFNHCLVNCGWYSSYGGHGPFVCQNSTVWLADKEANQIYRYCMMQDEALDAGMLGSTNNFFGINWEEAFNDPGGFAYSDTRTYELKTPDAYMGDDGTQIGINGGNYPWNKAPHTPVVKDLKLTISGKQLKVDYQAETR